MRKAQETQPGTQGDVKEQVLRHNILGRARSRHGPRELEVIAATFEGEAGQHRLAVSQSAPATIRLLLRANRDFPEPTAGLHLFDRLGNLVFATGSWQLRKPIPAMRAGEERVVTFRIVFSVQPGEYTFSVGCSAAPPAGSQLSPLQDQHEGLGPVAVHAAEGEVPRFYGIAQLPVEMDA